MNTLLYFLITFIMMLLLLQQFDQSDNSQNNPEVYENFSHIMYSPGEKWNINDVYLHGNDPTLIEEYKMLNELIDKTNALLKYSVALINEGLIKNHSVIECIKQFAERWKGMVQRMDYQKTQDAAITIDKTDVYICLRDKRTGALHSIESAMFVLIHEIAHMSTTNVGHTPDFWTNMKYLLVLASEAKDVNGDIVLPPQDFESKPVMYCGKKITGSPDSCIQKKLCKKPF